MSDSVAVDAKRILLRYGAPIKVLDKVNEKERIEFARIVSRTPVQERGERLVGLLLENGYLDPEVAEESLKEAAESQEAR